MNYELFRTRLTYSKCLSISCIQNIFVLQQCTFQYNKICLVTTIGFGAFFYRYYFWQKVQAKKQINQSDEEGERLAGLNKRFLLFINWFLGIGVTENIINQNLKTQLKKD